MITTSAEYKQQVVSKVQNWSSEVVIDYTDYNLDNTIVTSENNPDVTSDGIQLADGKESPTYEWISFANFKWGQHPRSEEHTNNEKGALSSIISNVNDKEFKQYSGTGFGHKGFGYFGFSVIRDYPRFIVSFVARTVSSLKVVFDDKKLEWAEEFDINVYVGATIDTNINVTNNTSYIYTETLGTAILLATSIEIVVKKWNIANSKARVMETFTSISETYINSDIIQLSIHEDIDPKNNTSPIGNITNNTCNVSLVNINAEFDNDNEASILSGNIIKNRRISPFFWLNSLTGDKIPGGIFYSTKWVVDNARMTAQVSGKDVLGLMSDV